jgi:hypothetical protein
MPPVWTDLAGAAAQVQDGDLVALGGHTRAAPMALIRELIRQGRESHKRHSETAHNGRYPLTPTLTLVPKNLNSSVLRALHKPSH